MKKIALMAIAMMALLAVSCQKEKDEELPTFTAHADNGGMKTDLVGNLICWNNSDQVKVFGDFGYALYSVSPRGDDPTWATLTPVENHGITGFLPYRFIYPAEMACGGDANNNTLYVTYPSECNINDAPLKYFPMYGESDHRDVAFHNLGGLIKIVLPEIDRQIVCIRVITDEPNNGKYQIGNNGNLVLVGTATNETKRIIVNAENRTFAEDDCVYISMPAGQYHNFTIKIDASDGTATKVANVVNVQPSTITAINISNLVFENREWQAATLQEYAFSELNAKNLIFHYNYTDAVPDAIRIDNNSSSPTSTPIYMKIIYGLTSNDCHVYTPASEIYAPVNSASLFAGDYFNGSQLRQIDFGNGFNTSDVTSMHGMFMHCTFLNNLDVSFFNTSNVTNMSNMFWNCYNLTNLDLSSFNTSNVTDMAGMFWRCSGLTCLNLSSFSSNSLTNFASAIRDCTALQSVRFSNNFSLNSSCTVVVALSGVGSTRTTTIKCNNQTKNCLLNADPGSGIIWDLY